MSNLMSIAFSGPGAVMLQLLGIGVGSWVCSAILTAIGKGQLAKFVQVISVFLAIGLAIGAVGSVINKIM